MGCLQQTTNNAPEGIREFGNSVGTIKTLILGLFQSHLRSSGALQSTWCHSVCKKWQAYSSNNDPVNTEIYSSRSQPTCASLDLESHVLIIPDGILRSYDPFKSIAPTQCFIKDV